jgi:3-oxoacyl-[acyl-carrier-protein] synthase II
MGTAVTVTGWSVHLPEVDVLAALPDDLRTAALAEPACTPERAHTLLGRKGLLAKEPATRLALCAVHRALRLPPGRPDPGPVCTDTAVVVASNLGNVGTVAEVARTVADEGVRGVSPLEAPNASSNVIASTVALWFRFGGPNLMVCSGSTAGLDAFALARLLLRAGTVRRVVLVGAEPADGTAVALHGYGDGKASLRAGAACVLLEAAGPRQDADLHADLAEVDAAGWVSGGITIGPAGFDPTVHWGDCYGAQGVLGLALAAAATGAGAVRSAGVVCGSDEDGWRGAIVHRQDDSTTGVAQ